MKARVTKITAILTMLLFVNYMFSNTVFIHSHTTDDGRIVTHSHPYLPSSHHGHSAQSLSLISLLNHIAASVETSSYAPQLIAPIQYNIVYNHNIARVTVVHVSGSGLRAPPCEINISLSL